MSRALDRADRIEAGMIRSTAQLYDDGVAAVIRRHEGTLRRISQLEEAGEYARVRVLARSSGLINELANAIAAAGKASGEIIRSGLIEVREVMQDDDAPA